MRPQQNGNATRDIFGADFNGTPSHHRVLKPPGGGSSDIFGATAGEAPRKVRNHQASSLVLNDVDGDKTPASTPSKSPASTPLKTPGNSHARLFGPASPPKPTPKKNASKSTLGSLLTFENGNAHNGNTTTKESQNGDVIDAPVKEEHQNGHAKPQMNGNGMNGSAHMNGNGNAHRGRVPPGGYSSGLW